MRNAAPSERLLNRGMSMDKNIRINFEFGTEINGDMTGMAAFVAQLTREGVTFSVEHRIGGFVVILTGGF